MKNKLNTVINLPLNLFPYRHETMIPNTVTNFYGTDSEPLFNRNLKNRTDWIYSDKEIIYNFNSDGLRMKKNLVEVDEDYIFFSGTSYSLGVGLHEDDRFSNTVSKELNLDFINSSGATYSCKTQTINFFNLINSGHKLPKLIIIEYPPCTAYTFYVKNKYVMCYKKQLPSSEYQNQIDLFNKMNEVDYFYQESIIYQHIIQSTCKRLGIKLIEISLDKEDSFTKQHVPNLVDINVNTNDINFCYARDYRLIDGSYTGHPGIGIHNMIRDMILKLV